jgi:hypothetical protein
MKNKSLPTVLLAAALMFSPLVASAQSTYTTANGELSLVAGLTNLTSVTAIGTTNQSVGINYITDSSWSATGIANLGSSGGSLAGTFGGANYFASSNSVILIGSANSQGNPAWGSWTVRMLLSNDTYSSPFSYTNSNLVNNTISAAALDANNSFFINSSGNLATATPLNTYFQQLNIADFDTGNIGVKGIELSSMGSAFPDISYIGVTSPVPVPEPSTYCMALAGLACGGYSLFRRRKRA